MKIYSTLYKGYFRTHYCEEFYVIDLKKNNHIVTDD